MRSLASSRRARLDPASFGARRARFLLPTKGLHMWAQLITTRLKAGKEEGLARLAEQLQAVEQPGSGLVRSTMMRDQNDPSRVFMLVVFESQEAARAREND